MATSHAVTVNDSPTRLDTVGDEHLVGGIVVYNNGASPVYLGGSDVTPSNGVPIAASSWGPGLDLAHDEGLYGVVAAGTCDVRVLEVGV